MNAGSEPSWDGDLFRLYSQRSSADAWQDDFIDGPHDSPDRQYRHPWENGEADGSDYSKALFGGPGADLFGSGFPSVSESSVDPSRDNGPPSTSMPSISQPMAPISQSMPSVSGSMPAVPGTPEPARDDNESGSLVRPYARTRGRTRTDYDLAIETLVSTNQPGRAQSSPGRPEHRSICGLCQEARSVAEIAAHLRLPLGVVRVLIGDMANLGLVQIHDSGMVVGDQPSMDFLERVLSGLRRL